MTRAILGALVLSWAIVGTTTVASAQSDPSIQAAGSPAPGVTVPIRVHSPGDSQQFLSAGPPAADGGAPALEGAGGAPTLGDEQPFTNNVILGLSTSGHDGPVWVPGEEIYFGVIPGHQNSLPHIARSQARGQRAGRPNTLTWIGFQPFDDVTRVFIQTGRPAQYQVWESPDGLTVVIRLRDTRIEFSNFRRNVDASFFGRAVNWIDAARVGDSVTEVTIALTRAAGYAIESEGEYIYVDFAN